MVSVVFIGTSSFAIPALLALHNDARFRILGVITQPAKPVGRKHEITPSPVEAKAKTLGLKMWSPEKISDVAIELAAISPDCLIVASYGQILPKDILDIPHLGTFNIHPSLLPIYRGPSPVPASLLAGEQETGVSIMLLDEKTDHGPILRQEKIKINEDITAPELIKELSEHGAQILPQTIVDFAAGTIKSQPQNHTAATYSKIFTREDGKIDFLKTALEIYNQYRALTPWPGIFAYTEDKKTLKLIRLARIEYTSNNLPGTLFLEADKLFLKANKGALEVLELQLEGGKALNTKTFINGYSKKLPLRLK